MINCIIIDDEPLARDLLLEYVRKTPFLHCVATCAGAEEARRVMEKTQVQLIFLDIVLPEITGLEFSMTLGNATRVIFTTAFEQYALAGFKANALGYLLKPFSYLEFLEAVNRAREYFGFSRPVTRAGDALFVKSEHKIIKVLFNEIRYIESMRDYVRFHLVGKPPLMSLMSMRLLEENLPPNFIRVHRSYIVNVNRIEVTQRNEILFGRITIPVAENYRVPFQNYLRQKLFE